MVHPWATGCCSLSLLFSFCDFWFVLSLCYTMLAQVMQGLSTIIQWFPLVESCLYLYGHFNILAFTLSLVSELSVPRSSVHLHSFLLMPSASSIEQLNNCCVFIADLRSKVVTTPFSSSPLLSRYITIEGRSEVFPPYWIPRHLQ